MPPPLDSKDTRPSENSASASEPETLKRAAPPQDQSTVVDEMLSQSTINQKDVFISYSQADRKTAEAICRSLEQAHISCWIAPRNIPAGKTWAEFIPDAIAHSRAMVLVLSASANESRQVKKEVDIADNKRVPIIPFRIEDVPLAKALEYHLAGTQWLNAYTSPLSKHLQKLEETVRSLIGQQGGEVVGPKRRPLPWRLIAAVATIVIVTGIVVGVWMATRPKEKTLTYSLTVQKVVGREPEGPEFQSTGQEPSYGNGWRYRMNVMVDSPGYLYILNEGTMTPYQVLFPTEPNNNRLAANETTQLPGAVLYYKFGKDEGIERNRIIFSIEPLTELDAIIRDAINKAKSRGEKGGDINDPVQVKTVRDIIAHYSNIKPVVNEAQKQSIIKGTGDVLVSLLEFKHSSTGTQSASSPILSATAGGITYTVLSSTRAPYSPNEFLLTVTVKLSTGDAGVNFFDDLFRLDVDEVKIAPRPGLSKEWVPEHSERKEDLKFIVRNDARHIRLIVGKAGTAMTAGIMLPLDAITATPAK